MRGIFSIALFLAATSPTSAATDSTAVNQLPSSSRVRGRDADSLLYTSKNKFSRKTGRRVLNLYDTEDTRSNTYVSTRDGGNEVPGETFIVEPEENWKKSIKVNHPDTYYQSAAWRINHGKGCGKGKGGKGGKGKGSEPSVSLSPSGSPSVSIAPSGAPSESFAPSLSFGPSQSFEPTGKGKGYTTSSSCDEDDDGDDTSVATVDDDAFVCDTIVEQNGDEVKSDYYTIFEVVVAIKNADSSDDDAVEDAFETNEVGIALYSAKCLKSVLLYLPSDYEPSGDPTDDDAFENVVWIGVGDFEFDAECRDGSKESCRTYVGLITVVTNGLIDNGDLKKQIKKAIEAMEPKISKTTGISDLEVDYVEVTVIESTTAKSVNSLSASGNNQAPLGTGGSVIIALAGMLTLILLIALMARRRARKYSDSDDKEHQEVVGNKGALHVKRFISEQQPEVDDLHLVREASFANTAQGDSSFSDSFDEGDSYQRGYQDYRGQNRRGNAATSYFDDCEPRDEGFEIELNS